jgi:hypothetical protein
LEELIKEIINQLGETGAANAPLLGMFVHEPELIDQVIGSVMKARKEHPLRQSRRAAADIGYERLL